MLKNFNYSLIALFFVTIFSACEKEADSTSPLTANSLQNSVVLNDRINENQSKLTISGNSECAGETVTFTASHHPKNEGKSYIQKFDVISGQWQIVGEGSYEIVSTSLDDNGTYYRSLFKFDNNANFFVSPSVPLIVNDCLGSGCYTTLAIDVSEIATPNPDGAFDVTFKVHVPVGGASSLKVQGGLTKGATASNVILPNGWTHFTGINKNSNTQTITASNVAEGCYLITLTINGSKDACNLTGAWSVVADGVKSDYTVRVKGSNCSK